MASRGGCAPSNSARCHRNTRSSRPVLRQASCQSTHSARPPGPPHQVPDVAVAVSGNAARCRVLPSRGQLPGSSRPQVGGGVTGPLTDGVGDLPFGRPRTLPQPRRPRDRRGVQAAELIGQCHPGLVGDSRQPTLTGAARRRPRAPAQRAGRWTRPTPPAGSRPVPATGPGRSAAPVSRARASAGPR